MLTRFASKLRTERLITCHQTAPAWVLALLSGPPISHVLEISYVDPSRKTVTMCSTNLTWSNILSVRETVIYQPETSRISSLLPSSSHTTTATPIASQEKRNEKTQFKQEAKITALCGGWQRIKTKIEEASVERFGQNAKAGREGFEAVLEMSRRVWGEEREKEKHHG